MFHTICLCAGAFCKPHDNIIAIKCVHYCGAYLLGSVCGVLQKKKQEKEKENGQFRPQKHMTTMDHMQSAQSVQSHAHSQKGGAREISTKVTYIKFSKHIHCNLHHKRPKGRVGSHTKKLLASVPLP